MPSARGVALSEARPLPEWSLTPSLFGQILGNIEALRDTERDHGCQGMRAFLKQFQRPRGLL